MKLKVKLASSALICLTSCLILIGTPNAAQIQIGNQDYMGESLVNVSSELAKDMDVLWKYTSQMQEMGTSKHPNYQSVKKKCRSAWSKVVNGVAASNLSEWEKAAAIVPYNYCSVSGKLLQKSIRAQDTLIKEAFGGSFLKTWTEMWEN